MSGFFSEVFGEPFPEGHHAPDDNEHVGMEQLSADTLAIDEATADLIDGDGSYVHPEPAALVDPAVLVDPAAPDDGGGSNAVDSAVAESEGMVLDPIELGYDLVEPLPLTDPMVETWQPGHLVAEVGDVEGTLDAWHYQGPTNACAIVAQGSIIELLTGEPFDQELAMTWLEEQGYFSPEGGTTLTDMTRLLEAHGVPHAEGSFDVGQIYDALADGKEVMVALDANEIWFPQEGPDGLPLEWHRPGGHAVWVTGIGYDEASGEWKVVLNDSGHPNGKASMVSLADFVNATDDYGNFAVIVEPSTDADTKGAAA